MVYNPQMAQTTPTGKPQEFLDQLQQNRTGPNRPQLSTILDQIRLGNNQEPQSAQDIRAPMMPAWLSSDFDKAPTDKPFQSAGYTDTLNQIKAFSDTANQATQNAINYKTAYSNNLAALTKAGMSDSAAKSKLGGAPPEFPTATKLSQKDINATLVQPIAQPPAKSKSTLGADYTKNPLRQAAINAAEEKLGKASVNAAGLVHYAFQKAGVPGLTANVTGMGHRAPISKLLPGDIVYQGNPAHNVALYLGGNKILSTAPNSKTVKIISIAGQKGWSGIKLDF